MTENQASPNDIPKSTTDLEKLAPTFGYPMPDPNPAVTEPIDKLVEGMFKQVEEDLFDTSEKRGQAEAETKEPT